MGGSLRSILPVSDGRWPQAIGVHGFGLCCDPVGRFPAHPGPGGSIMSEVPRTKTPLSPSARAAPMESAINAYPTLVPARDYIVALARVETGNGASLIANNFGNLSAGGFSKGVEKLYSGDYWRPPWFADSTNALHKKMLDGQAPSAFRAYGSASAGVRAYLGLLASAHYQPLIVAAWRDDVDQWVQQLHDTGYSRDYGPKHVPTFRGILADIRGGSAPPSAPSAPSAPSVPSGAGALFAVLAVLLVAGSGAWFALSKR